MYGLPNQRLQDALLDLQTAIDLCPTHLSWYHLTIEPNTFFHHKPPVLPDDDAIFEIQQAGFDLLAQHGFYQYEVSAFSKPGFQCHHNRHYWEFGDYIGIGAGAHGKITHPKKGILRLSKAKTPKQYLSIHDSFISGEKTLTESDLVFEFMLNALRLIDGFPIALFQDRTGLGIMHLQPGLNKALEKKLLTVHNDHVKPTALGNRFLNDLMALFL
jgi:oxygen-independent coproporphyrinogen-3 oxidase